MKRSRISFGKNGGFVFFVAVSLLLLLGCHFKGSQNLAKVPAEVIDVIIERQWPSWAVKVVHISYESPVRSKGGRVPAGIKLFPANVRVRVDGQAEKEIEFYFYQNAFGAWDAYRVSRAQTP